jgi:hypothetical protein
MNKWEARWLFWAGASRLAQQTLVRQAFPQRTPDHQRHHTRTCTRTHVKEEKKDKIRRLDHRFSELFAETLLVQSRLIYPGYWSRRSRMSLKALFSRFGGRSIDYSCAFFFSSCGMVSFLAHWVCGWRPRMRDRVRKTLHSLTWSRSASPPTVSGQAAPVLPREVSSLASAVRLSVPEPSPEASTSPRSRRRSMRNPKASYIRLPVRPTAHHEAHFCVYGSCGLLSKHWVGEQTRSTAFSV